MTMSRQLRVFTAFSGYDSQCMALDRLENNYPDFSYKLVGWSEIDKYAIQVHDILFPNEKKLNFGDISNINWNKVPDFDLFTYSSPCQDFSNAGFRQGGKKGSGTRSSLLWECEKAIKAKKPKYLLMENVPAIERYDTFKKWLRTLEKLGYKNYYQVLNATDYGVPQRRKRMFVVSIRNGGSYKFPPAIKLQETIGDRLEQNVDKRYYFSKARIKKYSQHNVIQERYGNKFQWVPRKKNEIACCVTAGAARFTDNYIDEGKGKIRQLTPYEYFRLMDVSTKRARKACNSGLSNSQLYKMAGNSIVVSCLYYIFRNLLIK